jgi:hypothetical protein
MQHRWCIVLLALLGILVFASHGVALAASTGADGGTISQHTRIHHDGRQDFRQGYTAGYNDCQYQQPYANLTGYSQSYAAGYDQGFKTCENQEMAGGAQGNADGYQDGYQTCQAQHEHTNSPNRLYSLSPVETGYQNAYGLAWNQGYQVCEAHYS